MDGAFMALLLLVGGVSAVIGDAVLPPENVTVSCQNLRVTVSWRHRNLQPRTSFEVNVTSAGTEGLTSEQTTELQYDLSRLIWASEERYMDVFYVAVRTKQGNVSSEPVESKTFSFNQLKTSSLHCELDFPPVDLDVKESGATVTFTNPFHFYPELEKADRPHGAAFHFGVDSESVKLNESCSAEQTTCRCDVTFPDGEEKCVNLSRGLLMDERRVRYVSFRQTGRVCVREASEFPVMALLLSLSFIGLVVSVLLILICRVKAWVMGPPVKLPKPLDDPSLHRSQEKLYHHLLPEPFEPTPLIESCVEPASSKLGEDFCESVDVEPEAGPDPDPDPDPELGYKMDNDSLSESSVPESTKTESSAVDLEEAEEDEQARSPYDCPHNLQVDLGDGGLATGYSSR